MRDEQDIHRLTKRRVLIMTAVAAEQEALLQGIGSSHNIDIELAGVGPAAAAASTARVLARDSYQLVISAGIAGGFQDKAPIGSVVIADRMIAADLGAETAEGFQSVNKLGFGNAQYSADRIGIEGLADQCKKAGLTVAIGPILTVSTVTGSTETAVELRKRNPNAVAEAMEGFGIAEAAQQFKIPVMELRTISNPIGPRNREAWRIKEALQTLTSVGTIIAEVFGE